MAKGAWHNGTRGTYAHGMHESRERKTRSNPMPQDEVHQVPPSIEEAWSCLLRGNMKYAGREICNARVRGAPRPDGQPLVLGAAPGAGSPGSSSSGSGSWSASSSASVITRLDCGNEGPRALRCTEPRRRQRCFSKQHDSDRRPFLDAKCNKCHQLGHSTRACESREKIGLED